MMNIRKTLLAAGLLLLPMYNGILHSAPPPPPGFIIGDLCSDIYIDNDKFEVSYGTIYLNESVPRFSIGGMHSWVRIGGIVLNGSNEKSYLDLAGVDNWGCDPDGWNCDSSSISIGEFVFRENNVLIIQPPLSDSWSISMNFKSEEDRLEKLRHIAFEVDGRLLKPTGGGGWLKWGNELWEPLPEPSAYGAGFGALGLGVMVWRRHKRRGNALSA